MVIDLFLALSLGMGHTFGGGHNGQPYLQMGTPVAASVELNLVSSRDRSSRVFLEIGHKSDVSTRKDRGLNTIMLKGSAIVWGM